MITITGPERVVFTRYPFDTRATPFRFFVTEMDKELGYVRYIIVVYATSAHHAYIWLLDNKYEDIEILE